MATIADFVNDNSLLNVRESLHKEKHLFGTYEEALNWLRKDETRLLMWHGDVLSWNGSLEKYQTFEEVLSLGFSRCDIVERYYTKDQLLEKVDNMIEQFNKSNPEKAYVKWWLDNYGKLEYVYIL